MLEWVLSQGYKNFRFTDLEENNALNDHSFETFKIIASHLNFITDKYLTNALFKNLFNLKKFKSKEKVNRSYCATISIVSL